MKRRLDGYIWIGLGIALLMALFLSPLASPSPDGLEKVAEEKGFAEKGKEWEFWKHAPLRDYAIPWIKNQRVSTALSGLVGTAAIFFIALGIGKLLKKPQERKMNLWILFVLFSLLCLDPRTAPAARPLSTDDAWTVEQGKSQFEVGMGGIRVNSENREFTSPAVLNKAAPGFRITTGLTRRVGIIPLFLLLEPFMSDTRTT